MAKTVYKRIPKKDHSSGQIPLSTNTVSEPPTQAEAPKPSLSDF